MISELSVGRCVGGDNLPFVALAEMEETGGLGIQRGC